MPVAACLQEPHADRCTKSWKVAVVTENTSLDLHRTGKGKGASEQSRLFHELF